MSILLAVAALALTPVQNTNVNQQVIIAGDYDQISKKEVEQRMLICSDYISGKIKPSAIISVFNLDTQRKRRDFDMQCFVMEAAMQFGYDVAVRDFRRKGV